MFRKAATARAQINQDRAREQLERPRGVILEPTEFPYPRSTRTRSACRGRPQQSSWETIIPGNKTREQAEEVSYYFNHLFASSGATDLKIARYDGTGSRYDRIRSRYDRIRSRYDRIRSRSDRIRILKMRLAMKKKKNIGIGHLRNDKNYTQWQPVQITARAERIRPVNMYNY